MGFRTYCDINDDGTGNKCRKEMEPLLDKETGIVYCECGKPMDNQAALTTFAKRQMLALGQVKRSEKKKQAYAVKCLKCDKEGPPTLSDDNRQLLCTYCKTELNHLNKPFVQMMITNLVAQKRAKQ